MSNVRTKVLWYSNKGAGSAVELLDVERITVKRGLGSKSNSVSITLKNSYDKIVSGNTINTHITSDGTIIFEENDVIEVYLKNDSDGTGIDTSVTDDLITTADIVEWEVKGSHNKTTIKLKCVDKQ